MTELEQWYPVLREPDIRVIIEDHPVREGWVRGGLFTPIDRRPFEELGESYVDPMELYIRPAIAGGPPPSILMTWWAVLFALSELARYEPAVWADAINPDSSVLAVPIEEGLRTATRDLPSLVYHGLTGRWYGDES